MTEFDTFLLSCFRLLEKHPLYPYRSSDDTEPKLRVLLVGNGTRMETLLKVILTNGQLLDTNLQVTVLHAGTATADNLLVKAPALKDFAKVTRNGAVVTDPKAPLAEIQLWRCAMTPEALREKLAEHSDAAYVLVSTGNDEKNLRLAQVCGEVLKDGRRLVACVQRSAGHGFEILRPEPQQLVGGKQNDAYLTRLEQIAYNLHYSYSKRADNRQSPAKIRKEFEKNYNYLSNLEAALHIRSKLQCCGIDTGDPARDAAAFAAKMEEEPAVVGRLSAVEHRRWVMEKVMAGYWLQEDMDQIFSQEDVTNKNKKEKWHTCLVLSGEANTISPENWDSGEIPPDMDPLDKVSIRIHRKCGELAQTNRGMIQSQMEAILATVNDWAEASPVVVEAADKLSIAISQLYQKNRNATGTFREMIDTLRRELAAESSPRVPLLLSQIGMLDFAVAPLIEYITYRNYKEQDELLVRQIPFALTHRSQSTIMKLMPSREVDCVLSTWQLEPERVIYMAWAEEQEEMERLLKMVAHIDDVLKQGGGQIAQEYHLFLSDGLMEEYAELPLGEWAAYRLERTGPEGLMEAFIDAAQDIRADYIDVTGADPAMLLAAGTYAKQTNTPMIYAKNGCVRNLQGAQELGYPGPQRHMTVREMFLLSGAVVTQSDSEELSDLSKKYEEFWNVVQKHPIWPIFAEECTHIHKNGSKIECVFRRPEPNASLKRKYIVVHRDVKKVLLTTMRRLQELSILQIVQVSHELDGAWKIEFAARGPALAEQLMTELYRISEYYRPGMFCQVRSCGDRVVVTASQLIVRGLIPGEEKAEAYDRLIQALGSKKILLGTERNPSNGSWSFRFGSRDILNAFQVSGKVLEYYLYYSALLEGGFDDVQVGWEFNHSDRQDSAVNELDMICTRGTASLFVSAKDVGRARFDTDHYLNLVYYEVSLLTERFGVNARSVLAAPNLPMFEEDGATPTKYMKGAARRGICLLGKECFETGRIAQYLSNIMDRKEKWWVI